MLSAVATTAIATGFTLYGSVGKNTYNVIGYDMYFYTGHEEILDKVHDAFKRHNTKIRENILPGDINVFQS